MAENTKQTFEEYKAEDFLSDVKSIFPEKLDLFKQAEDFAQWTGKGIDSIVSTVWGAVEDMSKTQQANFKLMTEVEPGKATPEQLRATIDETINAATFGVGAILKNDALKMLSKDFRTIKAKVVEGVLNRNASMREQMGSVAMLGKMDETYPVITKAIRQIPQEKLDYAESVRLMTNPSVKGVANPKDMTAGFNIVPKSSMTSDVVPHEFFHLEEIALLKDFYARKGKDFLTIEMKDYPKGFMEAHAYEFGTMMGPILGTLKRGEKLDPLVYDSVIKSAYRNTIARWGEDITKYNPEEVVNFYHKEARPTARTLIDNMPEERLKGLKEWGKNDFAMAEPTEEEVRSFAGVNNLDFQGYWDDMKGWMVTDKETHSTHLVRDLGEFEAKLKESRAKDFAFKKPSEGFEQVEGWHGGRELEGGAFSEEFIGSGEGLAAGHGVYMSDLKEVGEHYAEITAERGQNWAFVYGENKDKFVKDSFTAPTYKTSALADVQALGKEGAIRDAEKSLAYIDRKLGETFASDPNSKYYDLKKLRGETEDRIKFIKEEVTGKVSYERVPGEAQLHEVTAFEGKSPEEYPWLDWDKPVKEQSYQTQVALHYLAKDKKIPFDFAEVFKERPQGRTGRDIYHILEEHLGSAKEASKVLADAGIAGNRLPTGYFNGRKTPGKYNYVVFDTKNLKVKKSMPFQRAIEEGRK